MEANENPAAAAPAATPENVEFWFDVACPWCWMTSRWVTEVSAVRGFEVEWHPFSLKILNEGQDMGDHAAAQERSFRAMRVIEQARAEHGSRVVPALYTAMGTRIHPGGRQDIDAIIAESLAEAGLPATIAEAADSEAPDGVLRANTAHAMEIAGPDVGIPVISIDGVAFFGPVVTPAPTGAAALRLWDGIRAAASVPGFYELKRGRTAGPQF